MSYFIDVQGTLLRDNDKKPISGAIAFIENLNKKNIPYVVVTNNTKQRSEDFLKSLNDFGFNIGKDKYLDPFMVLKNIVLEKKVKCFGPSEFINVIDSMGYEVVKNDAEAILIASSKDFDSNDYADMIEEVSKGSKLIGMHATSIYAKNGKRFPGVGAILKMISYASSSDYSIIGKPSEAFYKYALAILNKQKSGHTFNDITMISDDAVGDLCGVKALGANSILVLSGKCKSEKEALHVKQYLDAIKQSIADIEVING